MQALRTVTRISVTDSRTIYRMNPQRALNDMNPMISFRLSATKYHGESTPTREHCVLLLPTLPCRERQSHEEENDKTHSGDNAQWVPRRDLESNRNRRHREGPNPTRFGIESKSPASGKPKSDAIWNRIEIAGIGKAQIRCISELTDPGARDSRGL